MSSAKPIIGLVGGVGCGKSAAAAQFAALGCAVIDADAIGHDLLTQKNIRRQLDSKWGPRVFRADGSVNRAALAAIVFSDASQLEVLNDIMRDPLGRRIAESIDQAQSDPAIPAIVLDAAILFEAGWDRLCSHTLFVSAPEKLRQLRAAAKGLSESSWRDREKSQISLDRKADNCYGAIDNSSTVSHLREQVSRFLEDLGR